jgi:septal ring-binding cell division protein DamX
LFFPFVLILALAGPGDWKCTESDPGLWRCDPANLEPAALSGARTVTPAPPPQNIHTPAAEENVEALPIDAWVLQVGAYRDRDRARVAADMIADDNLIVVPIKKDGGDWYVLLLGAYPTYALAQRAGEIYLLDHPGGSIWVRSAAGVRGAETK